MTHYHNNQLTKHVLDSDFVEPRTPVRSSKAPKRKRSSKATMSDNNLTPPSGPRNGMLIDGFIPYGELPSIAHTFGDDPMSIFGGHDSGGDAFFHGLPMSEAYPVGSDYCQTNLPLPSMFDASEHAQPQSSPYAYNHFPDQLYPEPDDGLGPLTGGQAQPSEDADAQAEQEVKQEEVDEVSFTPQPESEGESDYEERRPSKIPKIPKAPNAPKTNKDGNPRKPRHPRPKLLKWDDNDWKNVALGLVWACGENGIQIPFDQASQVVSESCTAGALQQALLKLRGKQIAEGFQIPSLRMAWTRKNKKVNSDTSRANSIKPQEATGTSKNTLPKKKPTRVVGQQSLVLTLRRPYTDADRAHLDRPHDLAAIRRTVVPQDNDFDFFWTTGDDAGTLVDDRSQPGRQRAGNVPGLFFNTSGNSSQMLNPTVGPSTQQYSAAGPSTQQYPAAGPSSQQYPAAGPSSQQYPAALPAAQAQWYTDTFWNSPTPASYRFQVHPNKYGFAFPAPAAANDVQANVQTAAPDATVTIPQGAPYRPPVGHSRRRNTAISLDGSDAAAMRGSIFRGGPNTPPQTPQTPHLPQMPHSPQTPRKARGDFIFGGPSPKSPSFKLSMKKIVEDEADGELDDYCSTFAPLKKNEVDDGDDQDGYGGGGFGASNPFGGSSSAAGSAMAN